MLGAGSESDSDGGWGETNKRSLEESGEIHGDSPRKTHITHIPLTLCDTVVLDFLKHNHKCGSIDPQVKNLLTCKVYDPAVPCLSMHSRVTLTYASKE